MTLLLDSSPPLVSVVIPSFNHAKFIPKTIDSINAQTYKAIEIIVLDDSSQDDSARLLTTMAESHGFKLVLNPRNMGLVKTLNMGLGMATGVYFAPCASDDYWHPEKIEKQVARMEATPNLKIVFTEGSEVDSNGNLLGPVRYSKRSPTRWYFDDVIFWADLPPASFMARRSEMLEVGGYPGEFRIEDLPMWLALLSSGGYAEVVKEDLAYYRNHEANMHNVSSSMVLDEHYRIISHFSVNHPLRQRILKEWNLRNGNFLAGIDKPRSMQYLRRAVTALTDYRLYAGIYKNIVR